MTSTPRRVCLLQVALAGGAAYAAAPAPTAGAPAKVDEKHATAVALGHVAGTTKADQKKFPGHATAQKCSTCALYQGKAGDASGPCPIFAGKLMASGGWSSSWVKKG